MLWQNLQPVVSHEKVNRLERSHVSRALRDNRPIVAIAVDDAVKCEEVVEKWLKVEIRDVDLASRRIEDCVDLIVLVNNCLLTWCENHCIAIVLSDANSAHTH